MNANQIESGFTLKENSSYCLPICHELALSSTLLVAKKCPKPSFLTRRTDHIYVLLDEMKFVLMYSDLHLLNKAGDGKAGIKAKTNIEYFTLRIFLEHAL